MMFSLTDKSERGSGKTRRDRKCVEYFRSLLNWRTLNSLGRVD